MNREYTILVAGARGVDAGKTTVTTGLVHALDAVGLKPRAGNDFWYDYDTVSESVAAGRLVGKDAMRLARTAGPQVEPTAINPLHRLWRPMDRGRGSIFGRERTEFLVDRVADEYVVNATTDVPAEVRSGLPLEDALLVGSLGEMNDIMDDRHRRALDGIRPIIRERDRVVIESYADVARPLRDVDIDVVAVVGPGRLTVFDGDRYCRAAEVVSGSADMGQLEERVGDVVDLIDPVDQRTLQPLPAETRGNPERVAEAYQGQFEALLRAAE